MEWREALELRVAHSGHVRYRQLCADDNPDHLAWRARMLEWAGQPAPPRPRPAMPESPAPIPIEESIRLVAAMNACPYRSTKGCGCSGARCALRKGATVNHTDCFDCLRQFG